METGAGRVGPTLHHHHQPGTGQQWSRVEQGGGKHGLVLEVDHQYQSLDHTQPGQLLHAPSLFVQIFFTTSIFLTHPVVRKSQSEVLYDCNLDNEVAQSAECWCLCSSVRVKININNEPPPHREIYFILQPAAQLMMFTLLEKYDAF